MREYYLRTTNENVFDLTGYIYTETKEYFVVEGKDDNEDDVLFIIIIYLRRITTTIRTIDISKVY